jgi:hypothetical protein
VRGASHGLRTSPPDGDRLEVAVFGAFLWLVNIPTDWNGVYKNPRFAADAEDVRGERRTALSRWPSCWGGGGRLTS